MSDIAEVLGLPDTVIHKGKEYKLAPVDTLEVAGQWEVYLEECAWDALERRRDKIVPDEYRQEKQDLLAEIAGGTYSLYEKVSVNAMRTPFKKGFRRMVYFRLLPFDPGVTQALADEMADAEARQILEKLMRAQASDPNSPAPAAAGAPAGASEA